jgi:hypothetical protein
MNYYEEFDVPPDAPAAKIRQAYKTLARLLHPDAQFEQALKAMAERQMRRLNAMLDTLLDPETRRAYDESLFAADHPPRPAPAKIGSASRADGWGDMRQAALRQWFWILTGLLIAGVGVWYMAAKDMPVAEVVPARMPAPAVEENMPSAGQIVSAAAEIASPRTMGPDRVDPPPRGALEIQPDSGDSRNPRERLPLGTVEPPPSAPRSAPAQTASEPEGARGGPGDAVAGGQEATWAGSWLYLPQPEEAPDAGLYVPSYIEFLLVEENGTLAGNYRARYRVPNKALPPEVRFRVDGKAPGGTSARLVWASEDGAAGEVELTLRSSNLLNVTWWTTAFGRRAGLTSGTATLVRQRVR